MYEDEAIAVIEPKVVDTAIIEQVMIDGDLSKLPVNKRIEYYGEVCRTLGLNPLTKPFAYLNLNGKLRLYALRDCTDQLRRLHKISIEITKREQLGEVYIVTARASMPDGRTDESTGAVFTAASKGDNLANAFMKAETKAKRRVTLSIAGLGWLDESELDTLGRIERPATRETHASNANVDDVSESDADLRDTIMNAIMDSLRSIPKEQKARRIQLMHDAFGCGWSGLKEQSVAQLQTGYRRLQELMHPAFVQESVVDEEDVPDDPDPSLVDKPQDETSAAGDRGSGDTAKTHQIAPGSTQTENMNNGMSAEEDMLTKDAPEVMSLQDVASPYPIIAKDLADTMMGWRWPVSRRAFATTDRNLRARVAREQTTAAYDRVGGDAGGPGGVAGTGVDGGR